jgi:uncharacterized protein YjbI with pentapeptide repeats
MVTFLKRLFTLGYGRSSDVQVEEPPDVLAAEQLIAEEALGKQANPEPPSEEELKEFLIKNFLEGEAPAEPSAESAATSTTEIARDRESADSNGAPLPAETADSPKSETLELSLTETQQLIQAEIAAAAEPGAAAETGREITPEHSATAEVEGGQERAGEDEEASGSRSLPPTLTEIPEALPPTITEILAEHLPEEPARDPIVMPSLADEESPIEAVKVDSAEWELEEELAGHKEWLETRGLLGKKADLRAGKLEGVELISINLRYADLQDANLRAADLLLADLRDACMVRANLQDSCLVGANLEGANLEGASLDSAMGLVPRQLAGTNLREASVPEQIAQFDALAEFKSASQTAARFFTAVMALSFLSWLMVWKTKDAQLVTDSAIIPYLHSSAAAAALPTAEFYLIAPALLLAVYLLFQYHLQRLWDAVLELPAVFPDGRVLGAKGPWIITGLLRVHFRWMNQDPPSTRMIERGISALLAYWTVPVVLTLVWGRYLTVQEIHGTILQEFLVLTATGTAVYATTKIGRPQERWIISHNSRKGFFERLRAMNPATPLIILFVALTFLSVGTIKGVPHDPGRAPQFSAADIRRWAPTALWALGHEPYADLTEAAISVKPSGWRGDGTETSDEIAAVRGARLNGSKFRYAQAYGIFLVNAHLWQSDFQGAFLSEADLRGTDLGQATMRWAVLDRAQMNHANLDRADLTGANLARVDLRGANLSYSSLEDANLIDARLDGATLYGSRLSSATLVRANLEKADLRDAHLDGANLEHADLEQAYLWSAKLPGARLPNARLATAIFIDADLQGADLRGAQFSGTVLNGANLQDADLDGADLRGALQLSAAQVCSAKSRQGALLDDALQAQVNVLCGGGAHAQAAAATQ